MTLLHRIETTGPDQQRELLVEAYEMLHAEPDAIRDGVAWGEWHNRRRYARQKIDAGAYLSAAETLVPEGWGWGAGNCSEKDDSWASVTSPHGDCLDYDAYASTPALALLAAILRAREAQSVQPT